MKLTETQVVVGFAIFRIINAFLVQSQFDPDEYWQNLEPAYCYVFGEPGEPCAGLTWEWKRRPSSMSNESIYDIITMGLEGPLRSYVSILPTMMLYSLLKILALDSTFFISKGPILLNSILVSVPTDWAVWRISNLMDAPTKEQKGYLADWCTFCSLTSWFSAYALVRTYSNSLETAIIAVSLVLVAKEFIGCQLNNDKRFGRARLAFFLGGTCCSIRFTSLAAYIPIGFILGLQEGHMFTVAFLKYIVSVCAVPGLFGITSTIIVDRYFYGFWAIPFLGSIHFNAILGNGSLYGTHPAHWYLTAGIPAITGVMFPFLVLSFLRKWTVGERNLFAVCICYVIAHSAYDHKEFRFMLPLLPMFCLISGKSIQDVMWRRSRRKLLAIIVALANLFVFLYLGLVHQRGVVDVNLKIVELVKREPQTYTVHYLLDCHSTPLLSHLHQPPIKFNTWALDCSPDCRSNPKIDCESEAFLKDPADFTEHTYFHCADLEEGTCVTDLRLFYPDFLVTRSEHVPELASRFATMDLKEVGRFINGIDGIRVFSGPTIGSRSCIQGHSTKIPILFESISLCIDEIVLYENKIVNPRY